MNINDQAVIITGDGTGIGCTAARLLREKGAVVIRIDGDCRIPFIRKQI